MSATLPIVITRPAPQAAAWANHLRENGISQVVELPLIDIRHPPGIRVTEQIEQLLSRLRQDVCSSKRAQHEVLFFSSPAAVQFFFEAVHRSPQLEKGEFGSIFECCGARAWAPGRGTADALARHGIPLARIDTPAPGSTTWDSETLIAAVHHTVTNVRHVLLVTGFTENRATTQGRDVIPHFLQSNHIDYNAITVYQRALPQWDSKQRDLAISLIENGFWIFTSADALKNLQKLIGVRDFSQTHIIATHPRIGTAARYLGFESISICRPSINELLIYLQENLWHLQKH